MKKLKNIFYIICSSFFILTLTLSCGDQQSSTNEDIDYMEEEAFNKLMEEEVTEERDTRDGISRDNSRRKRNRRRHRNQLNIASDDPMAVNPADCAKEDSDYFACKYHASRQITDMARDKEKGNVSTHEVYNCLPLEDKKEFLKEKIQVILVEYSYVGATPKYALLCEVQSKEGQSRGRILGYAHHEQGFCRSNNRSSMEPDSLNEALEEYQNLGYQCTKEEENPKATKEEHLSADISTTDKNPPVAPVADNSATEDMQDSQPKNLEIPKPPWVEEE